LDESIDDVEETAERGDQTSESLPASLEGGVRATSYEGIRVCESRGFRGNGGLVGCRCSCPFTIGPLRDGGGDIGLWCGDWKPSTWSDANSASESSGDNLLIASQKRFAKAIRRAFGAGRGEPVLTGDMIGVRGGVTRPAGACGATAAVDTETVAMTWFNRTPLHLLYRASPTYSW
jgi:hypothetical protein